MQSFRVEDLLESRQFLPVRPMNPIFQLERPEAPENDWAQDGNFRYII
jgi:hypothetical protein